jgi:YVTN family beta-propeller protein
VPELPTGTVTFLFTDIEGSTRLLKQLRDRYTELVAEHRRLLRAAFVQHGGVEVDSQGDAFFVVFRRAEDGVAAAASLQRVLAAHAWPDGVSVRVRVGIHTGHASVSDGRYHGVAVHRAARIMAAAHGGQVLLSQTTRDLLTDEEADLDGIGLKDLGEQRLKDLAQPVRIYQLLADGLPREFPRLRGIEKAPSATDRVWRRWKLLAPALLGVLAAAVAIPIFALGERGSGGGALSSVSANAVGLIDVANNKLTSEVPIGTNPNGIAAGAGAIWVTNADSHTVSRIDPATNTQRQTIDVGSEPEGIAFGRDAVWVANGLDGTVSRIDPATNRVADAIPVGNGPTGVTVGFGSVWVTNANDGTVSRVNPDSGAITKLAVGAGASGIAIGAGAVWVANEQAGTVSRIDPTSNAVVTSISVGNGPSAVAFGPGGIWVANGTDGTVSRISPDTNRQTLVKEVGEGPSGLAVGGGAVWVANEFAGSVSRIDLENLSVHTTRVGNRPTGIAVLGASVYVAVRAATAAHRGGTLVALYSPDAFNPHGPAYLDPGIGFYPNLGWIVYDTLVAYEKVGGSRGFHLVADLAKAIPTPTDGATTYTFQLRPNLHYSDGRPVEPSDFLYALERSYKLKSSIAQDIFAGSPVGGDACLKRPQRCDLSRGVVVDSAIDTLEFHLVAPDPDFIYKLTQLVPVPPDTPIEALDAHPPPGTGPYLVSSNTAKQLTLVRNPRFHVWSHAARPDGYPDKIIARPEASPVAALREAERGRVDFAEAKEIWNLPPAMLREIETKYAGQAYFNPFPWTSYFLLNTRLPPFDDVRVRKAVNYAFDRSESVRLQGGPHSGRPTCQLLPPNFPGYRRYCPYTLNPSRGGEWSAPDLTEARRLVAASGTKGMPISVWACDTGCYGRTVADSRYFAGLLRRLGYRAHLKVVPLPSLIAAASRGRIQTALYFSAAQLGVVSEFFSDFRCRSGRIAMNWGFCDRTIDEQIKQALMLQTTDAAAANALWARIDREIVDQAAIVPILNPNAFDFVSKRVGNYQYNQGSGGLRDQLWVR